MADLKYKLLKKKNLVGLNDYSFNVSQKYTHLKMYLINRCDRAVESGGVGFYFNGDENASNYAYINYGVSHGSAAGLASSGTLLGFVSGSLALANGASIIVSDIYWYTKETFRKNIVSKTGVVETSDLKYITTGTKWNNTDPIESIKIWIDGGSSYLWTTGSQLQVYGVN